ncbi:hypothetical protein HanXRQr2_Chr09g0377421 [Helianthus annuus]|uniref:Uncharacterized protein n=1 Tax=Helianthus annuus TaxID=4232 RepID=A0A9K3I4N9_HELAN|nr:hypothetical protein HanXRQr2_Chr09g0377421 [Helianthus annuus]KAJ0892263.1 hypothetical protein HanPSC8_Chr09g0363841 [Helianthus annuus]
MISVVSKKSRDPRIQIIFSTSYTLNGEISTAISFTPKLIVTLHSLCHDPTSPGGANPTYAPFPGISSS